MTISPFTATAVAATGAMLFARKQTLDSSEVNLIHAKDSVEVCEGKTLVDIVKAECPSLADPAQAKFVPTAMLPNTHLMTCFNSVKSQFMRVRMVKYERELINTEDGGTIGLDWSPPFSQMPEDDRPIVLLSHGLSGGSQEEYVQQTVKVLTSAPYNFRTVVVNFRGCAGVPLTTPVLYNAGFTSDYGFAVSHVQKRFPQSKLAAVGFSLGANLITKFVGEQGENCPLKAAVSVCNPYDLYESTLCIERPKFSSQNIYTPAMLLGLKRIIARHREMMETSSVKIDFDALDSIKRISQFDDIITSQVFGYKDSNDYYKKNSSAQFMPGIRVPYLAISSLDDPVCPESALPREAFASNPYLMLALTFYGGHLGYHEDLSSHWFPRPAAEFCRAIFNNTTV